MNLQSGLSNPAIIGHRGFKEKYPENTFISFQAAVDAGAHMIELDVTLSKDRKLIVIHDDTLDRTTNGNGSVQYHTLAEIKQLDAGTWFNPCFTGERIPTLNEVLDLWANRIFINIEIKSSAFEPDNPQDAIERQVVSLIQTKKCRDSILVSSFKPEILYSISTIDPMISLGFLTEEEETITAFQLSRNLTLFSWNPDCKIITKELVQEMHDRNVRVFPYTVNSVTRATSLFELGVDGLFTDDPALMMKDIF
jgi:glycerophosphoryl diester phosphodiesterase